MLSQLEKALHASPDKEASQAMSQAPLPGVTAGQDSRPGDSLRDGEPHTSCPCLHVFPDSCRKVPERMATEQEFSPGTGLTCNACLCLCRSAGRLASPAHSWQRRPAAPRHPPRHHRCELRSAAHHFQLPREQAVLCHQPGASRHVQLLWHSRHNPQWQSAGIPGISGGAPEPPVGVPGGFPGGMHVGPHDPLFAGRSQTRPGFGLPEGPFPGARYDPINPEGLQVHDTSLLACSRCMLSAPGCCQGVLCATRTKVRRD